MCCRRAIAHDDAGRRVVRLEAVRPELADAIRSHRAPLLGTGPAVQLPPRSRKVDPAPPCAYDHDFAATEGMTADGRTMRMCPHSTVNNIVERQGQRPVAPSWPWFR